MSAGSTISSGSSRGSLLLSAAGSSPVIWPTAAWSTTRLLSWRTTSPTARPMQPSYGYQIHQLTAPAVGPGLLAGADDGLSYQERAYRQILFDLELYLGDPVMQAVSSEAYPYALTGSGADPFADGEVFFAGRTPLRAIKYYSRRSSNAGGYELKNRIVFPGLSRIMQRLSWRLQPVNTDAGPTE